MTKIMGRIGRTSAAIALAWAAVACSGDDDAAAPPSGSAGNPGSAGNAGSAGSAGSAGNAGNAGNAGGAGNAAFSQIDAIIEAARAKESPVPAITFVLVDRDDHLVYARSYGAIDPTQRLAVASASKMVSGLALFGVIGQGQLSLDSTTGQVLGWPAPKDQITLEHLLSFTSGLPQDPSCTSDGDITLAACVDQIAAMPLEASPGTEFAYGSSHLHVAARMAEVATGKPWATIFDERVRLPLGLPAEVAYFTAPRQALGVTNPLIAGGLRASTDEYTKILGAIFHRGVGLGVPDALFTAQTKEPFQVAISSSPVNGIGVDFHYGLTAWLECDTPMTGCATISSPGTFGFTPWLDRDTGYYAILGMELKKPGSGKFSVPLQQSLKPAIAAALGE